jgi:hypothetical protein
MREAAIVTAHAIPVSTTVVAARLVMEKLLSFDSDRTVIPLVVAVNAFARRTT